VVGLIYCGENQKGGEVAQLWQAFDKREPSVPNQPKGICPVTYGVCFNDNRAIAPRFCYVASVEVESLEDILMDMVGKTLPANTYAVFTHRGSLTKLGLTCQYIYGKWLPNSDYVLAGEYDFEHYDQRFQGTDNENTEFDIYVPVKATGSAGARRWPDGQRQRSPSL
jgi:AraC family transcriptional regulator